MARPLRIEYSGAVDHISSRGNEKKAEKGGASVKLKNSLIGKFVVLTCSQSLLPVAPPGCAEAVLCPTSRQGFREGIFQLPHCLEVKYRERVR